MPRKNNILERRKALLPVLAGTFAELGYRRTTTAELSRRCAVQENILYRVWRDKKAMFLDAIEYVFQLSEITWAELLKEENGGSTSAERILSYESTHHGEFGLYRIVFAGLSETDDPEIRDRLRDMYTRFHAFIRKQVAAHRKRRGSAADGAELSAWALMGIGTVANISRELGLLTDKNRKRLFDAMGRLLLEGA